MPSEPPPSNASRIRRNLLIGGSVLGLIAVWLSISGTVCTQVFNPDKAQAMAVEPACTCGPADTQPATAPAQPGTASGDRYTYCGMFNDAGSWTAWFTLGLLVLAVVASVIAYTQLQHLIETEEFENEFDRKKEAIGFSIWRNPQVAESRGRIKAFTDSARKAEETQLIPDERREVYKTRFGPSCAYILPTLKVQELYENNEKRKAKTPNSQDPNADPVPEIPTESDLRLMFSHFENAALSVFRGTVDEDVLFDIMGLYLVRQFKTYILYVEHRRLSENNARVYEFIEWLVFGKLPGQYASASPDEGPWSGRGNWEKTRQLDFPDSSTETEDPSLPIGVIHDHYQKP